MNEWRPPARGSDPRAIAYVTFKDSLPYEALRSVGLVTDRRVAVGSCSSSSFLGLSELAFG